MPDSAFIVEGVMEQKIIQKLCPGKKVVKLEVNGRDVTIEAIIARIETHFRAFGNRYWPIFVIFDREGRSLTCNEIVAALSDGFNRNNLPLDQFILGVSDRMIENWILADWEAVSKYYELGPRPETAFEGANGKAKLRSLIPRGRTYQGAIDGVDIFVGASAKRIAQHSCSFRDFSVVAGAHCSWL